MLNDTEAQRLEAIEHLNTIFPREDFWAWDDDDGTICCNAPAPATLIRIDELGDSGALNKYKTATIGWLLMVESGDLNLLREAAETKRHQTLIATSPLSRALQSVLPLARVASKQTPVQPGQK